MIAENFKFIRAGKDDRRTKNPSVIKDHPRQRRPTQAPPCVEDVPLPHVPLNDEQKTAEKAKIDEIVAL